MGRWIQRLVGRWTSSWLKRYAGVTVNMKKINWYLLMLTPQKIQPAFAKPRLWYSSLG